MSASTRQILPAVCPLDCPDTCSLAVTVQDERIVAIRGSRANPYTDNAICSKVAKFYPDFVHGEQRLRYPLKRTGPRGSGQFARISWDEAIELIHTGFQQAIAEHGPQSVLGFNYAGPHGELAMSSLDRRFFNVLGATQLDRGPLCAGVRSAAYASLFGDAPGMPPEQCLHSDLIIHWGFNAKVAGLHYARLAHKAQKQGAQLVVIDPKRIVTADRADLFLAVVPGTDVVLALALAAELERRGGLAQDFIAQWVESSEPYLAQARQYTPEDAARICGIELADFHAFVEMYLQANNVAMAIGVGMEHNRNGGSGLRAAMALQALTGQFGRVGAGVMAKQSAILPRNTAQLTRVDLLPAGTRTLSIIEVGQHLLDADLQPPLKAMLIYNHNPLAMHPDQHQMRKALSQESVFIAGCDVVITDSMKYCDVILPAASVFEIEDIYPAYGNSYLQRAEPVIPLVGEALPNTEIFRRLAKRFGMDDALFQLSDKELMDQGYRLDDPRLQGYKPSQLPLDQALMVQTAAGEEAVMCQSIVPTTASGKIELYSTDLEQKFGYGLPRYEAVNAPSDYPLRLVSPASDERCNATFGGSQLTIQPLEIHPDDAAAYGVADGDEVRVWNALGEVFLQVEVSTRMKPGILYTPKGGWLATSKNGQTVNALISASARSDIMGGACYHDTFVAVAPSAG